MENLIRKLKIPVLGLFLLATLIHGYVQYRTEPTEKEHREVNSFLDFVQRYYLSGHNLMATDELILILILILILGFVSMHGDGEISLILCIWEMR